MLGYTSEEQRYPREEMRALFGDRGDFIALVANSEAAHLLPALSCDMNHHVNTKALPVPLRGEQMPSVRLSDHSPFWDQGYNAMMVTDTSFMRNPHYHKETDTIETLDLPFLMAVKPSERTEMAAVYSSFRDVSGIVTPAVAGMVLAVAPVAAVFAACGGAMWIAYTVAGSLHPRLGRPRSPETAEAEEMNPP